MVLEAIGSIGIHDKDPKDSPRSSVAGRSRCLASQLKQKQQSLISIVKMKPVKIHQNCP